MTSQDPRTLVSGAQGASSFADLQPGTLVADEFGRVYGTIVGPYVSPARSNWASDASNLLVIVRTDAGEMTISGRFLQPLVHGPATVPMTRIAPSTQAARNKQEYRPVINVNLDAIDDSQLRSAVAAYAGSIDANGIIRTRPGKFESEPIWTVYFWELTVNGEGEDIYYNCAAQGLGHPTEDCDCESTINYTTFTIQAGDAEAFPWLEDSIGREIRVWTDSQGFTMSRIVDSETIPA